MATDARHFHKSASLRIRCMLKVCKLLTEIAVKFRDADEMNLCLLERIILYVLENQSEPLFKLNIEMALSG